MATPYCDGIDCDKRDICWCHMLFRCMRVMYSNVKTLPHIGSNCTEYVNFMDALGKG